mgnify:CR=1 FL=1
MSPPHVAEQPPQAAHPPCVVPQWAACVADPEHALPPQAGAGDVQVRTRVLEHALHGPYAP